MITWFRIKDHHIFKDEELCMLDKETNTLKFAFLFGANDSGKTQFLNALINICSMAAGTYKGKLDIGRYDLGFSFEGELYSYIIEVEKDGLKDGLLGLVKGEGWNIIFEQNNGGSNLENEAPEMSSLFKDVCTDHINTGKINIISNLGLNDHPATSRELVNQFRIYSDKGGQLICTTHQTQLMNDINPESIWFANRKKDYTSDIYPLTDFSDTDLSDDIEKKYLIGRFGAIPFNGVLFDRNFEKRISVEYIVQSGGSAVVFFGKRELYIDEKVVIVEHEDSRRTLYEGKNFNEGLLALIEEE